MTWIDGWIGMVNKPRLKKVRSEPNRPELSRKWSDVPNYRSIEQQRKKRAIKGHLRLGIFIISVIRHLNKINKPVSQAAEWTSGRPAGMMSGQRCLVFAFQRYESKINFFAEMRLEWLKGWIVKTMCRLHRLAGRTVGQWRTMADNGGQDP